MSGAAEAGYLWNVCVCTSESKGWEPLMVQKGVLMMPLPRQIMYTDP